MKRVWHCVAWLLLVPVIAWGQVIVGPDQMNQCDQATFTVTITNASATQSACALTVTHTLPNAGFVYVPGSTVIILDETAETFTDDPISNVWDLDAIRGSAYALPPGETITISYDMQTTCAAVSGTDIITVDFEDCDDPDVPLQNVSSTSVEILPGTIIISKTPAVQAASVGDLVTWTITVENTGLGSVSNVEITDVLGSGLAYSSDTGNGVNAGQTTTWDAETTPALASIDVGASVSIDLTAEVISCSGLVNDVDASFGCGPADSCFDSATDGGTATASLDLLVDNPDLSFTPPNVTVGYCTDETAGLIQITNSGAGTARNVQLCCDFAYLTVDPTRLPPGTTYTSPCFSIPDISGGETFDLTFYVLHPDVDWCAESPSGDNVFELTYTNDCNIPFVAFPQFSTLSSSSGPSLAVTKTGPDSLRLGETGSYDITVEYVGSIDCGSGSPGPVSIVDTYPEGFTVIDPAGGAVNAGARTITWAYDPNVDPPFAETIQLEAPSDCGYCATPSGGTDDNSVTATGTDCCGCTIMGTATAPTTILCEGYGGIAYFSSSMTLNRTTTARCSSDYAVTVTHTYTFIDDPALDDFLLNEFTYFVEGNSNLLFSSGTAAVTGATLGTVVDNTPAGRLKLPLTDTTTVRGKTITYEYTLIVQDLDSPSCQASTTPIYAGVDLEVGAPELGLCGTMYADPPAPVVTAEPPSMSVSISGIPVVQEYCATYDVTITLNRTSTLAKPYDVRVVLTNNGGSILDMAQAVCGGTVSPTDGTTCTSPVTGATTYEWRFADLFDSDADVATITFPVTVPCSGPLADLSVAAYYDDLCHDDTVYNDSCSTSASDEATLSLSANVYTRKSPEILYATTRDVSWSLVVHNTGNGTAYNVWVDDVLGSGLVFDEVNTLPVGATVSANQDHEGNPINGASFLFDELAPGELKTITLAADLVACTGLTNSIAASWGCDGESCQTPRTGASTVVVPTGNLVATSFSPTPVPMCSDNPATVTLKNAGVTTLYNIAANVTLPAGLIYLGNPEFSVDGGTIWNPAAEPVVAGQLLTWTSTQIATLADMVPKDVVKIRFTYTVGCGFTGGKANFQAAYENPCATPKLSNLGSFTVSLTPAAVVTAIRQVSPAAGEAIDCGGEATWEIDVTNDGTVLIPVVQVVATLDDGLAFADSAGVPGRTPAIDSGTLLGQTVTWEIKNLAIDEVVTLSLTAASAASGLDCRALDVFIDAAWGCGAVDGVSSTNDADCTTTSPTTASISATRQPPLNLSASLSPSAIEGCEASTTLTLAVTNTSAVATTANIDTVITLPAALSYVAGSTEIDCGGGFVPAGNPTPSGQTLTWYDIAAEGGASDACETIPPGGTIQLRFDVDVSCYFTTQNIPITVYYFDCCGNSQYTDNTSVPLTSLRPALTIDKSPVNTTLDCSDAGDTATWTITVENTGTGTADWIRVVDTLGSSLVLDASDSPTAGAGIAMGANTTGWEIGPLAPAETFTATVTAHLAQPTNDCSLAIRRNTATVLWGCGSLDGDPNTTAEASCDIGSTIQDQANVRIPNLSISPSDITPVVTCSGDGVAPSSGEIRLAVRNSGDGDITADFEITLTETTTGYSVSDRFTTLGGTLPLTAGTSQILTFAGWNVGCGSCDYTMTAAVDFLNEICECNENDNLASLPTTITLPDVVIDSASLTVTCAADGQIRIQGPVTLRNDGCGDPLTSDVLMRFRVFDGPDCTGTQIDTFTVVFSGLSLAANGGTDQQTINVVRTLAVCNVPDCQLSIRIEADDNNAICECDGTNNALCAGNFAIASPDLTITDIDFSNVTCASDTMAGFVRVTIGNTGCGDSGAFDLRLATDGCLTFADEPVANVAAGGSTTVDFAITGSWADCGDCSCTFTATVDPANAVCECDGTNNALSEPFTSKLPDLEISGAVAAIGCAVDGHATVSADVTVENTGCSTVTADFDMRVTVYDGANCTGNVVDTWIETISGETIAASGSNIITLTEYTLSQALCAGDCDYSAQFEVDANNGICECDGTDNTFCLSSITSEIPNLVVTDVDPTVDCRAGTAQVTATVGNTGCGDATGIVFRLTSPACGLSIDSAPVSLIAGASQDVVFAYTPNCGDWNCIYIVTADPDAAICECDGDNALTFNPYPGIGSIGDRVWFDFNGDGVQDPGEDGIPNVTVIIEGDLDGDGSIDFTAETTTDANGEYLFEDLPAGDYTLTVDATTLPEGLDQTYDYDGLVSPHTSDYALAENEHNREQDFGYRGSGSIGDYVWFDINGDGIQDPSESGIENVTVTLRGDVDGDGIIETLTTTTDADGLYLFNFLPAGDYTITVDDTTLPDGLAQTYDYDGVGTAHTSETTLGAGEHNREQDFGYATPALSVDKIITDILRGDASIGNNTGPVEPGDVIVYQFVIENVGPVPAYGVGFDDTLSTGIVIETDAPHDAGSYSVSAPSASGSLGLSDGITTFNVPLALTVNAGETLSATFTAIVTSAVSQGGNLTNLAHAYGLREDGTSIPPENVVLGDTSDTDAEDPDPDDTGIVVVTALIPALSVDKTIIDITRGGESIGIDGPVEPGDIVSYRFVITNVGGATAYQVEFSDTLPPGMETVASGTYSVSAPSDSGSLGISSGTASFTTAIHATIFAGETLTAEFDAHVTSDIEQGVDLVNTAEATGLDGFGSQIPDENPSAGDTSDGDAEDPDADDTGIAIIGTEEPALSVDKIVTDIVRKGSSIGTTGPVEPGDIVFYQYTIENVGLGTAYNVEFSDTLPTGMITETDAPGDAGSYVISSPSASGTLAIPDAVGTFSTSIAAVISGGQNLIATYTVLVTSDIEQGTDLINVAAATGLDGAGNPIPGENADLGDTSDADAEDSDADDTGITILGTREPALSLDKRVTDVIRDGLSVGVVDPVLYGDIIQYTVTIRNVGQGRAYDVDFDDVIPAGLEIETAAPGNNGTFVVSAPTASGSLALADGVDAFTTDIHAILDGGGTLTAVYTVLVTPSAAPGIDLINTVSAFGVDGAGSPIPGENAALGDTFDDDVEDPDADDTGIATVRVGAPALVTRKAVIALDRQGTVLMDTHVEPGDIVTYEVGITNVGSGPAQNVNLVDTLPRGFVYEGNASAAWPSGSSTADPTGLPGPSLTWELNASLESGEELVLQFDARVTSAIEQAATYTNTVTATGEDAAGQPIPPDHRSVVAADDDPDDSSDVTLVGAVPALVTDKSVLNITRNDSALGSISNVQSFDVVTYKLRVKNVGQGTAYEVNVRDVLPSPFLFISGTTQGTWPYRIGTFTRSPAGAPGPTLLWEPKAVLESGDELILTFNVLVDGAVLPGETYTNVLQAEGIDGAGTPIPPNQSADVPQDNDPDDRDDVSLTGTGEAPALITTKRVTDIIRNGDSVIDRRVEAGDIVEYEMTVRNVGTVSAYEVNVTDRLPFEFTYIQDTTSANWPLGSAFSDPIEGFNELQWPLRAALRPDDQLTLRFRAFVIGPIYDGSAYTNTMQATGEGPDGSPIPADQRSSVPDDIDPDDASQATLIGRSSYVQGEGGVVAVPILRKTVEVLSSSACEAWNAIVDRLWFQTDIALYAASEFERLGNLPASGSLIPDSLLPTWSRTVQFETANYAFDNLIQVAALSSIGIALSNGPLMQERAAADNISSLQAVEQRLDALALRAGVAQEGLPLAENWIYLEAAGGEPVYQTWRDSLLGPAGEWTEVDDDIVASAVGMGMVKQVMEATTLLTSARPIDRYVGSVLVEILANKILALEDDLTIRDQTTTPTIPHSVTWNQETETFTVIDESSLLFDQLSLVWGLAQAVSLIDDVDEAWPDSEATLRARVSTAAKRLLHEVLMAIDTFHVTEEGTWLGVVDRDATSPIDASTVDLGLLLVGLEAARPVIEGDDVVLAEQLIGLALDALIKRQGQDGWFSLASENTLDDAWNLLPQLAGIRGLLAGLSPDQALLDAAQAAFDALDSHLWVETIGSGLYASYRVGEDRTYCYTPLAIGLAAGALRELALRSEDERQAHILTHLSGFIRTIVDEAALQLSNALPAHAALTRDGGVGTVGAIRTDGAAGILAPVLQQRLCLSGESSEAPCSGWTAQESVPWYQTDISMYAAYMVQDGMPAIEDYADANLSAVTLHSRLGILFTSIPYLEASLEQNLSELDVPALASTFHPIALPYAAGSPALIGAQGFWDAASFDTRIVASAQGMTLLREAQEARQWLNTSQKTAQDELQERILMASILQKLIVLQQLQMDAPGDVLYVPHAVTWDGNGLAAGSWTTQDASSTTFDQLSLLLGLSEAYTLLTDLRAGSLIDTLPFPSANWGGITLHLIDDVLRTLEVAHLDPIADVLIDTATPVRSDWSRKDALTTVNLGLLSTAFDHVLTAIGEDSTIGNRARELLEKETAFLTDQLTDPRGGYDESWSQGVGASTDCDSHTLIGQLAALRALLAAHDWLELDADLVKQAFDTVDVRFWDASLFVYRTPSALFEWCVTPLDLGLSIDTFSRMPSLLTEGASVRLTSRLASHVDRLLDGVPLQLSDRIEPLDTDMPTMGRRLAPVFDARACFRPIELSQGEGWAKPGDTIRYTVSAENATEEIFTNLVLEDRVPDGLSVIATDPLGEIDDAVMVWTFDELAPSEKRTWQIVATIDDAAAMGEIYHNCATLTYTNVAGEPQPQREACADIELLSPEDSLAQVLQSLDVTYRTDEAMHLAAALEALACAQESDWLPAPLAHELANANLGNLLTGSNLGVPLYYASQVPRSASLQQSLDLIMRDLALSAGLSDAPAFDRWILLPYESGVPILLDTAGFSTTSDVITPAALGWTLAREVQFVASCARRETPLDRALIVWSEFLIANQLEWIATATIQSSTGDPYLPQAIRATRVGDEVSYGVSDTRSTVHDQASLLIGLLAASQLDSFESRTQRLAEQLATETFEQLVRHWDPIERRFVEPLESGQAPSPASWIDLGIAAQALTRSYQALPRVRDTAESLLESLATEAMARGRDSTSLLAEAGRLLVLLNAASVSGDAATRETAQQGWQALLDNAYDPIAKVYVFSLQAARGWGHTPEQLAILFDILGHRSEETSSRPDALRVASSLLFSNIIKDRVRLLSPAGMWTNHAHVRCTGVAAVFGEHRGELPAWVDLLP